MNMVFAYSPTIVIEFNPKRTLYHPIAAALHLPYWAIVCVSASKEAQKWGDDDYVLPLEKWERTLKVVTQKWGAAAAAAIST